MSELDEIVAYLLSENQLQSYSIFTPCGVCFADFNAANNELIRMTGHELAMEHIELTLKVNSIIGQGGHRIVYPIRLDDIDFLDAQFGIHIHREI